MGADLYINSITEPARAKYEPLFNEAVERRDSLMKDRQGYEAFIAIYDNIGEVSSEIRKQVKDAKAKVKALKTQITAAQEVVTKYYNLMDGRGGYFRDSYNGSSILWRLGLSWWKDIPGGKLTVEQLRGALNKIKAAKFEPITEAELRELGCKVDNGENSVAVWNKMFRNKKRRLVRFFERAIKAREAGSEVYFSL